MPNDRHTRRQVEPGVSTADLSDRCGVAARTSPVFGDAASSGKCIVCDEHHAAGIECDCRTAKLSFGAFDGPYHLAVCARGVDEDLRIAVVAGVVGDISLTQRIYGEAKAAVKCIRGPLITRIGRTSPFCQAKESLWPV